MHSLLDHSGSAKLVSPSRQGVIRRPFTAAVLAVIASLLLVTPMAAGGEVRWEVHKRLRETNGVKLQDAAFRGSDVAVVWQESDYESFIRTSVHAGRQFADRQLVADSSRQAELDICADDLYVAYAREKAQDWAIDVASRKIEGRRLRHARVSVGDDLRLSDVACAGGRLFVSWVERTDGRFHLHVDHARRSTLQSGFGENLRDLGPVSGLFGGLDEPVLAGVRNRAYIAWTARDASGPRHIVFNGWRIGGGPQYAVSNGPRTRRLGDGGHPVIAARGDKVVVAWIGQDRFREPVLKIRVSNDRGTSFEQVTTVRRLGQGVSPLNVAIKPGGSRVAVAFSAFFEGEPQFALFVDMLSSSDDFATYNQKFMAGGTLNLLSGFLRAHGGVTLAAAEDRGNVIRFLRRE